jgi:hypothetical protein
MSVREEPPAWDCETGALAESGMSRRPGCWTHSARAIEREQRLQAEQERRAWWAYHQQQALQQAQTEQQRAAWAAYYAQQQALASAFRLGIDFGRAGHVKSAFELGG